jgi:hypothetical protein
MFFDILLSKLFTRKKFINFNKFMVKCRWKKCFLTFYLVSCFTRKKFINFNKFMVKWGESRTANSDRGLVLAVGGSRKTKSRAFPRRDFFPDSGDRDSDKTFQISRNLGLEHVEFVCLLDSQLWTHVTKSCSVSYLKIVPKAGHECTTLYTGENRPMKEKKRPGQIWCGFQTILKISKCLQRSKQKLCIYFSLLQGRLKIVKPFAHVQKGLT